MRLLTLLFLVLTITVNAQIKFEDYFVDKTLRMDYFHTGNKTTEIISFESLTEEGAWPGSLVNLIDTFEYGYYMVKVFDTASDKMVYSRGYSTLFQEWQTSTEAETTTRSFSGTVTMPFPKNEIRIEIHRRDRKNIFNKIFDYVVSPDNYFIRKGNNFQFDNFKVHYSGDSHKKLDILFIPEGYTEAEMDTFVNDCNRFKEYLFYYSPFKEFEKDINIWGVKAYSKNSGADIPKENVWKETILNSTYYTFDSERYLMTEDYHRVRDVAANAPYDQIYILVNSEKYGGGAIYNYYNVGITGNRAARPVFVHELGHGLAGLADEYGADATYNDYYPLDVEPWEANITTLVDFESKWKNLVEKDTPIPTQPSEENNKKLGAFEGAGYVSKGVYRPTHNSIMRSFSSDEFNIVCEQTLRNIIIFYAN